MSTILFGYGSEYASLLDALVTGGASRPIYLMPGDGRKGSAVRSVPIFPHQVNEMTDFALTHQAETVILLDRECIACGAADDARALDLNVIGPNAADAAGISLKKLRLIAEAEGLPVLPAHAFAGARGAAEKNTLWPALLLSPDGAGTVTASAGLLKNALSRRAVACPGGEWYVCPPPEGPVREVSLLVLPEKTTPVLYQDGDEGWISLAEKALSTGYSGFFTLRLRYEGQWMLEGYAPLPAAGTSWRKTTALFV